MPRFRFKLDPLLETRRRTERTAQRSVAELERARRQLEAALTRQQERITAGKGALGRELTGTLDMWMLRATASSTIESMRQGQRLLIELAGVHKRWETARADLEKAAASRRAVELLRERRFLEWRRAQEKAENAALDELVGHEVAGRSDRP